MDRAGDETTASWRQGIFPTTRWTDVFLARSGDDSRQRAALEHLLARYWKPVYCYLRCKGYDTEAAKDLTQGFFHEVVLGRHLIQRGSEHWDAEKLPSEVAEPIRRESPPRGKGRETHSRRQAGQPRKDGGNAGPRTAPPHHSLGSF